MMSALHSDPQPSQAIHATTLIAAPLYHGLRPTHDSGPTQPTVDHHTDIHEDNQHIISLGEPRGTPHPKGNMTVDISKHDDDKAVIEYVEQVDEKAVPQAGFIVVSNPPPHLRG